MKSDDEVYKLVPMLKSMTESLVSESEKKRAHDTITAHHVFILKEILKENSLSKNFERPKAEEAVSNLLWFHEPNIWDCIFRSLEIKNRKGNRRNTKI